MRIKKNAHLFNITATLHWYSFNSSIFFSDMIPVTKISIMIRHVEAAHTNPTTKVITCTKAMTNPTNTRQLQMPS